MGGGMVGGGCLRDGKNQALPLSLPPPLLPPPSSLLLRLPPITPTTTNSVTAAATTTSIIHLLCRSLGPVPLVFSSILKPGDLLGSGSGRLEEAFRRLRAGSRGLPGGFEWLRERSEVASRRVKRLGVASRALRSGLGTSEVASSGLESAPRASATHREPAQTKSGQLESAIYSFIHWISTTICGIFEAPGAHSYRIWVRTWRLLAPKVHF